jgi:lipid II:glycine glycyltransferase (peptidoglycan interpeptide bridge formation enzyme)
MRERRIASGFFRFHPLFPVPAEVFRTFGSLTFRGQTVSIDLTLSEQAIWQGFRHGHKENIKRARKGGFLVAVHHDTTALEEFVSIYEETMHRVGAEAGYFFPESYFQELSAVLGERLWICIVRLPCGEAIAGSLLVQSGPIVQYHLGGTRTRALTLAPIKLLHDFVWRYAKAHGGQVLHLGGGVGSAADSLFEFKAGFSDRRHSFHTWEVVFLNGVYQSLTARRREVEPSTMRPGYFPAYRA